MDLYIVGAGGLGRETLDAVLALGRSIVAFVDERRAGDRCRGLPVIPLDAVPTGIAFVVGIADPLVRRRLVDTLTARGLVPETVVHPRAVVGPETTIEPGSVVLANAHVSSSVTVGAHVHVHYNATIGHDAVLADRVTVLPGANVAGNVRLGPGVTIGSNACVLPGLEVAAGTVVGAGAVVTRSCGPDQVVTGVPARPRSRG